MRAYVFTDQALKRHAGRFVWLAVDGEKPQNAALHRTLNITAYPTFYIMDPRDERVALRWLGSMTVPQMERILDSGERAVRGGGTPLDGRMVHADSLYAAGSDSLAALAFDAVLTAAPPSWPDRQRALESLLAVESDLDHNDRCAMLAEHYLAGLPPHSMAAANVAAAGLGGAFALPAEDPRRGAWIARFEPVVAAVAGDSTMVMTGDDRSGLYGVLIDARDDAKDSLGTRRTVETWSAALDRDAGRAKTPEQRTVYDSHRLSAYIELGQPERAVPMLQQSEREFPDDYNPPARLALAYKAMQRWDDALAASDRALRLVYGPRTLTVYRTRTDIYEGKGDRTAAARTLQDAIAMAEKLPQGQRSDAAIASLKKRLESLQ